MAAGTPVVAPNNTCMPQQLGKDSERGYMYPCNDEAWIDTSGFRKKGLIPDIVKQMVNVYNDGKKENNPKVELALKYAQDHDWSRIVKYWVKLFDEVSAQTKTIAEEV
jgi:glycosyltransferase involved in cell wall biosynthesis